MSLINYKDIDFNKSINKENKIIEFNGGEIQIVNYLSINEKYDLVMTVLKRSFEEKIYNPIKMDMYFNLYLVYLYTNIIFNDEDKLDEEQLYDILFKSGLINLIKNNIDKNELNILEALLKETLNVFNTYNFSIIGFLTETFDFLKDKVEKGFEVLKNTNPELIKEAILKNSALTNFLKQEENN